jgi:hypothetical protein
MKQPEMLIASFRKHREILEGVAASILDNRKLVSTNSAQNPAAAAHLITLFDQRLAILDQLCAAHTRLIALTSYPDEFDEPVKKIKETMGGIENNLKVLRYLTEECSKIGPDSKIRGEGQIQ